MDDLQVVPEVAVPAPGCCQQSTEIGEKLETYDDDMNMIP